MHKLRMTVLCGLAAVSFAASAQNNARIDAMGGIGVGAVSDITNLLYNPAYMLYYPNQMQLSLGPNFSNLSGTTASLAGLVGPFIGIKSFGDAFSCGLVLNKGLFLNDAFYTRGVTAVNNIVSSNVITSTLSGASLLPDTILNPVDITKNVPHLLLGTKFGEVALAADLFYEFSNTHRSVVDGPNSTLNDTTVDLGGGVSRQTVRSIHDHWSVNTDVGLSNFGFILGSNIAAIPHVPIALSFGMSFPNIKGTAHDTLTSNTSITTTTTPGTVIEAKFSNDSTYDETIDSKKFMMILAGANINFPLFDITWGLGANFKMEQYQFRRNAEFSYLNTVSRDTVPLPVQTNSATDRRTITSKTDIYTSTDWNFSFSGAKVLADSFRLVFEDAFGISLNNTAFDTSKTKKYLNRDLDTNVIVNELMGGLEKVWLNVMGADAVSLRGGLIYRVEKSFEIVSGKTDDRAGQQTRNWVFKDSKSDESIWNSLEPSIGSGFSKGKFRFDWSVGTRSARATMGWVL
jgi:hypothetical protein